jgi:hypothetical protein
MEEEKNGFKMRRNYDIQKFARTDRYWHVPRSFTDRSGWNKEIEASARWRVDDSNTGETELQQHLFDLLNQRNPPPLGQQKYDVNFDDVQYDAYVVVPQEEGRGLGLVEHHQEQEEEDNEEDYY